MIDESIPQRSNADAADMFELLEARWTLRILLLLAECPRRFADLRQSLPGISAKILTARLQALTVAGLVRRSRLPAPASVHVYEMTAMSDGLRPTLIALEHWRSGTAEQRLQPGATPV